MIRLSRAGREQAIINAIRRLKSKTKYSVFSKGEICRTMGVKSSSRIRDILREMTSSGRLVCVPIDIKGYAHVIDGFAIPEYHQTPLNEDHVIVINGVSCRMSSPDDIGHDCAMCGKPNVYGTSKMCPSCLHVWNS